MPRLAIAQVGGATVELDHASNGRVNSLVVANPSGPATRATVVLTDGRTFGGGAGQGTTTTNLPSNAATVTMSGGEATIAGIAYVRVGGG